MSSTSRSNRRVVPSRGGVKLEMRHMFRYAAAAMALAFFATGAQATTLQQVKSAGYIRGATANEVPYGYMDENGDAKGIGPDVAAAVFKSIGVPEIEWTVTPFG